MGNGGERFEGFAERAADDRDLRDTADEFVRRPRPLPELLLLVVCERRAVAMQYLDTQPFGQGCGGAEVAIAHLHRDHERRFVARHSGEASFAESAESSGSTEESRAAFADAVAALRER